MNRKERTVRGNTARGRAWSAMRVLRSFDVNEIVHIAGIQKNNAKAYITLLGKTGYLKDTKVGFVLTRDTGVKAPVMVQDIFKHRAYDPNLDAYFEGIKEKRVGNGKNLRLIKKLNQAVAKNGQAKVARTLGLSETTVCLVLKGKYPASTKNIEQKIKEVL